jgi:hypothetical protein
MHLLLDGSVNVSGRKAQGKILMTERSAFFLLSTGNPGIWIHFGLVGILIGRYLARKHAERYVPEHMKDPEILALDEKTRRNVSATALAAKIPLDGSLVVQETRLGYKFESGSQTAEISSWSNKKKIARALADRGIVANPRR